MLAGGATAGLVLGGGVAGGAPGGATPGFVLGEPPGPGHVCGDSATSARSSSNSAATDFEPGAVGIGATPDFSARGANSGSGSAARALRIGGGGMAAFPATDVWLGSGAAASRPCDEGPCAKAIVASCIEGSGFLAKAGPGRGTGARSLPCSGVALVPGSGRLGSSDGR